MKNLISIFGDRKLRLGVAALTLTAGASHMVLADAIPYPNAGTPNPDTYTFTATTTGDITAFFVGRGDAGDDDQLGLFVNGVSTGVVGLDNQTSTLGQGLDLGHANAGDTLTFEMLNLTLGMNVFSDPALNVGFDGDGSAGHNHVYATGYTATDPVLGGIPPGTFIGFEDLPFPGADFNYGDEMFVVTNVSVNTVPDSTSSLALLGIGLAGIGLLRRHMNPKLANAVAS